MANNKDDTGKGCRSPARCRRPGGPMPPSIEGHRGRGPEARHRAAKPLRLPARNPPPRRRPSRPSLNRRPSSPPGPGDAGGGKLAATLASLRSRLRTTPLITHLASGAVGAVLVLAVAQLFAHDQPPARSPERQRPGAAPGRCRERARHAARTRGLRSRVDELGRSLGALGDTQAKLAARYQGARRQSRQRPGDAAGAARSPDQARGHAGGDAVRRPGRPVAAVGGARGPARRAAKGRARRQRDDAVGHRPFRQRAFRHQDRGRPPRPAPRRPQGRSRGAPEGSRARPPTWRPLTAKLAALEQELQTFLKTRGRPQRQRLAHRADAGACQPEARHRSRRTLCRRAGARSKKVAGDSSTLTPLERYMLRGRADAGRAGKSFRKVANAMLDAEAEPADATARRPAAVGRALDRARAQGRPRRRRHQRSRPSSAAWRPPSRTAASPRCWRKAKKLPPKAALAARGLAAGRSRRARPSSRRWPTSRPRSSPRSARPAGRHGARGDDPHRPLSARGPGARRRPALARRPARHHRRRVAGPRRRDQRVPRLHHAGCCWSALLLLAWSAAAPAVVEPGHRRPLPQPAPAEARARCALRAASSPSAPATARSPPAMPARRARRCPTSRSPICCARRPPSSTGDRATARRIFEAMLASPDTEQLGLRGLFLEAQREGEHGGRAPVRRARAEAQPQARLAGRGAVRSAVPGRRLAGRARHAGDRAAPEPRSTRRWPTAAAPCC